MAQKYVVISQGKGKKNFQISQKPLTKRQAMRLATAQKKSLRGTRGIKTSVKSLYALGLALRSKPKKR